MKMGTISKTFMMSILLFCKYAKYLFVLQTFVQVGTYYCDISYFSCTNFWVTSLWAIVLASRKWNPIKYMTFHEIARPSTLCYKYDSCGYVTHFHSISYTCWCFGLLDHSWQLSSPCSFCPLCRITKKQQGGLALKSFSRSWLYYNSVEIHLRFKYLYTKLHIIVP